MVMLAAELRGHLLGGGVLVEVRRLALLDR